jgi:hypothetical protein
MIGKVLLPHGETKDRSPRYSGEMEAHRQEFIEADTSEKRLALLFKTQDIMHEERLLDDKYYCFLNIYVRHPLLTFNRLRSK